MSFDLDDLIKRDSVNKTFFRYDTPEGHNVAKTAIFRNDSHVYKPEDKIECVKCTTEWAAIFVNEMDPEEIKSDPILKDIVSKKTYMTLLPEQKCYKCFNCGNIELLDQSLVKDNPKVLKADGLDAYDEYRKITKTKPEYTKPIEKRKVNINSLFNYDSEKLSVN